MNNMHVFLKSPCNLNEQTLFHFAFYGQRLAIFDSLVSISFKILTEVQFFQLDVNKLQATKVTIADVSQKSYS